MNNKLINLTIFIVLILMVLSLILSFWLPIVRSFRLVFGLVYALFLPGLSITFIFFDKKEKIDIIERVTLSFALSIAIVPLLVFYLNRIGMEINVLNVFLTIGAASLLGGVIALRKTLKKVIHRFLVD